MKRQTLAAIIASVFALAACGQQLLLKQLHPLPTLRLPLKLRPANCLLSMP